ncbi:MAG: beta-lactamase family protein [Verrucomicrobia subdivision 3 bacterium]|nr:beta-lactamase family protein [Verrucomicrobiota bacterium]MCC6820386.1 beta-lactamase family protein [Limisphaerales bacterium]
MRRNHPASSVLRAGAGRWRWLLLAFNTLVRVAQADPVDDLVLQEMHTHQIPGVALTVIKHGREVKTAAYGVANLELNVPVRSDTVFEIGSVTKQFTAAAILLLQQQGKLSVNDPLSKHLPAAPGAWTNITIRHLLTHTSGIKNYTGLHGFEFSKHLTQRQFIQAVAALKPDFAPGAAWKYSNSGYNLLGLIVENVSGQSYWQFLRDHIWHPLGMNATTDRNPGVIITNRAAGYEQTNHVHINRDYDLTDIFSAGAIVSTVGDLARWHGALDGEHLLTRESKLQMWTPARLNDGQGTSYGFGWFIQTLDGRRNIAHNGATSGFSASAQRYPDDGLNVIVLTNTDEMVAAVVAKKVAALYLDSPKQP